MTPKDAFLASLARCEASAGFAHRFYRRFLSSSEDVVRMFRHTDFNRQQRMLVRSLELSARATAGDPDGLEELQARTESHRRLAIPAEMYDLWLAAAIATARECDPQWNAAIEGAWHELLGFIIHHMTRSSTPAGHAAERRRLAPVMFAVSASWRTTAAEEAPCLIGDLSLSGCLICGHARHARDMPIEVTLTATGRPPLALRGHVGYEQKAGFSVAFDELAPEQHDELARLLVSLRERGAARN